jgi:ribosomal subunit interface protein
MRLELTGRHIDIAATLRRLVERKLARLERVLNHSALSAQVVLSREKHIYRAEISLHARGETFLHGVGASSGWEPCVSQAIDKIVQQATRVKGKWQARKRSGRLAVPDRPAVEAPAPRRPREPQLPLRRPRVLQTSRQTLKSMSLSEAAREIDATSDGLVVFRDATTTMVSVLYKRANGELTLIETDV